MVWSLQMLRFFAALLVVFFHLHWMTSGYKGVDLFFVLSGFVMHRLLAESPPPPGVFAWHRVTRIFPLYWLALIALFLSDPFEITPALLQTVMLIPGHEARLMVSWSLSYELYFYLLAGLITYFVPTHRRTAIFLLLFFLASTVSVTNALTGWFEGSLLNFMLGANCWQFLLGVICGHVVSTTQAGWNRFFDLGLLAVILLFLYICFPFDHPYSRFVYGPLSFFLILGLALREKRRPLVPSAQKLFGIGGDASYALYLFSPVVIDVFRQNPAWILPVSILASILISQYVEKPILKASRAWFRK